MNNKRMVLNVKPGDSLILMFRRVLNCSQNQAAIAEAQLKYDLTLDAIRVVQQ